MSALTILLCLLCALYGVVWLSRPSALDILRLEMEALKTQNKALGEALEEEKGRYSTLLGQKKSSEVRLGFLAEQIAPVLDSFPYKEDEIHHMGQPIDFIVYRPDEIVFIEIKSGAAQMSPKQKAIRELIEKKAVRFELHKITPEGYKIC